MATTLEGAAQDVAKWLNERPNSPLDLRHVAMLVHAVQTLPTAEPEPFAWATFDGEGGYDLRLHQDNENYRDEYLKRNGPQFRSWVTPLYATPHTAPLSDAWISVDERLPDPSTRIDGSVDCVLVLYADGREPECASRWMVVNAVWAQKAKQHGITHWQPLPPAPIERAVLRGGEQT